VRQRLLLAARLLLTAEELKDLVEYNTADLVIANGGTTLIENHRLEPHIFDFNVTLFLRRPLILFTQSLGPFRTPSHSVALRRIFDKSTLVLLRDRESLDNLLALGVANKEMYITADVALALGDADAIERAANNASPLCPSMNVAISAREWKFFRTVSRVVGMDNYIEALRTLTAHLVERYNARVTYLSSCQGVPEYSDDDSAIASRIVEGLPDGIREWVMVDKDFHPPDELMRRIREYDLVIATRLHMSILALSVGVPVLPIAYTFNGKELFERLGQGRWVQDIEEISGPSLLIAADAFLKAVPGIRRTLFGAVQREREQAIQSVEFVKRTFEKTGIGRGSS
jgi:colanic acid/amylovoran biosynthesis protein